MKIITFVILVTLIISGIPGYSENEQPKKISVFVSILPQSYFVERIGGEKVEVNVLVLPGDNHETYSPTPKQITNLSKAEIFFRIGVPFENSLMPKIENTMPDLVIVDTRKGIELRNIENHSHENETEITANKMEEKDPHIWMSPSLVAIQAINIRDALTGFDPESKSGYEENYNLFKKDLDDLDIKLKKVFAPLKDKEIFVFHPAFGYFADSYGLKQVAIEEGGKDPSPKHLLHIVKMAKERGVKVIFAQKHFSKKSAEKIAELIDGAVVLLDPLAKDYIKNMEEMALKIEEALK
jgi:zinc transport system substrate-binding protein